MAGQFVAVSSVQFTGVADEKEATVLTALALIDRAAEEGARLVATASDAETVRTAILDLDFIDEVRRRYPLLDPRRPELHREIAQPKSAIGKPLVEA